MSFESTSIVYRGLIKKNTGEFFKWFYVQYIRYVGVLEGCHVRFQRHYKIIFPKSFIAMYTSADDIGFSINGFWI